MKERWYYSRGLNSPKWRKKYFYKYRGWLWDKEQYEREISYIDHILFTLMPMMPGKGDTTIDLN